MERAPDSRRSSVAAAVMLSRHAIHAIGVGIGARGVAGSVVVEPQHVEPLRGELLSQRGEGLEGAGALVSDRQAEHDPSSASDGLGGVIKAEALDLTVPEEDRQRTRHSSVVVHVEASVIRKLIDAFGNPVLTWCERVFRYEACLREHLGPSCAK